MTYKTLLVLILLVSDVHALEIIPDEELVSKQKKMLSRLLEDLPPKKASAVVSDLLGGSKKEIYNFALEFKNDRL